MSSFKVAACAVALCCVATLRAEVSDADIQAIKKEMAEMRERLVREKEAAQAETAAVHSEMKQLRSQVSELKHAETPILSDLEKALPPPPLPKEYPVTTSGSRVQIGGLLQVWYYAMERDRNGLFSNAAAGNVDHNIAATQNTFQVRRAELNTSVEINDFVRAFMKVDFAAESDAFRGTFAQLSGSNQGYIKAGMNNKIGSPTGSAPAILQDTLINFHDFLPHHDFTIGQMLPYFSEENFTPNGYLDFVERSWMGNLASRDIGAALHGAFIYDGGGAAYQGVGNSGRVQYWLSIFNSPGYYHDGATQLTADNNSSKDFLGRLMVRPLWSYCLGHLELSGAYGFGKHGSTPLNQAVHQINSAATTPYLFGAPTTWGQRWEAYAEYRPQSFARGLWFKYEYGWVRDSVSIVPGKAGLFSPTNATAPDQYQPFPANGFYASAGFNLGQMNDMHCLPNWTRGLEFDARYQRYSNVWNQGAKDGGEHVNTFATKQATFGVNYYLLGNSAKIQANYDLIRDPKGNSDYRFHPVRNDTFSMNFQVVW